MTLDDAYRALHTAEQAVPFRPFKLLLAGGWVVPVTDPERIAFEPGCWEAVILESGGQYEICLQHLIRLRLGGAELLAMGVNLPPHEGDETELGE
jgi:hypothetical protein